MKICILNDAYLESSSPFAQVDSRADPAPYLVGHQVEQVYLRKRTSVQHVKRLVAKGFDVFINLCDGAPDEDRPGIEVVQTLELLCAAFTGADSRFYNPSRSQMKQICQKEGILTPTSVFINDSNQLISTCSQMEFPLIVKHPNSYGSIGLTRRSVVKDMQELAVMVQEMVDRYGAALVEEFISGKEFSVLVAENPDDPLLPIAFRPIEVQFTAGETFKHFDLKWLNYEALPLTPCMDPVLEAHLKELSARFFLALDGVSYARCDLRVNPIGKAYMLEINPNCGLFYPLHDPGMADAILLHDPRGHAVFVELILRAALNRKLKNAFSGENDIL